MPLSPPVPLGQEHIAGARLFADRNLMIASFAPRNDLRFAEIGVAYGDFSQVILDSLAPAIFDAYDLFSFQEIPETAKRLGGKSHAAFYADRFRSEMDSGRMRLFVGDSSRELQKASDGFYDMIYIDGDHSYEGVRRDTDVALGKLKRGGILIFNDYTMYDHIAHFPYGVVHVVNDLCVEQEWRITHFALHNEMFCDVVIQKHR